MQGFSRSGSSGSNDYLFIQNSQKTNITIKGQFEENGANRIELFEFSDRTITAEIVDQHLATSTVTTGADTLYHTPFNSGQKLGGGGGNDTYVYRFGSGDMIVSDSGSTSDEDRLRLDGITLDQVSFERPKAPLVLPDTFDRWHPEDQARLLASAEANRRFSNDLHLTIDQDGQQEQITIEGYFGSGSDRIERFEIDGKTLDHTAIEQHLPNQARPANDGTYIYGLGYGDMVISDIGSTSEEGRLRLDGVTLDQVRFERPKTPLVLPSSFDRWPAAIQARYLALVESRRRLSDDLHLTIDQDGKQERITIKGYFGSGSGRIERVEIGGETFERPLVEQHLANQARAAGNDTLTATALDLQGLHGGAGNDQISGSAGDDRLFGDGDDDTLRGGRGNDHLIGGEGNDTYVLARGDGHDTIDNAGGGRDRLVFEGAAHDQLLFKQLGLDLVIETIGTDDRLTVEKFFNPDGDYTVDEIETGDDRLLLRKDVVKIVEAMAAFDPMPSGATRLPDTAQTHTALTLFGPSGS